MDMFPEVESRRREGVGGEFRPVPGCEACEKGIAERQGLTTVYGYQFRDVPDCPPFGVHWHVRTAQRIVQQHMFRWITENVEPAGLKRLDVDQIRIWMEHALDVSEEHALHHITDKTALWPGIMFDFTIRCIPEQWRGFLPDGVSLDHPKQSILMDGNHRALRHLLQNRSMNIVVLTTEEVLQCFAGLELGNLLPL